MIENSHDKGVGMNEDRYRKVACPASERGYRVVLSGQTEDGWRVSRSHTHHTAAPNLETVMAECATMVKSMPGGSEKLRSFKVEVRVP
jgi:hypothetical protein